MAEGSSTVGRTASGRIAALERLPQPVAVLLVVTVSLGLWQLVVTLGNVPTVILPPPVEVIGEIGVVGRQLAEGGFLAAQMLITVQEILIGFLLACGVGYLAGVWIGLSSFAQKAVLPLIVSIEATPKIAFAPVFIAWFGFGMTSKFLLAAFVSLFPTIIGTVSGLAATPEREWRLFESLRASRWEIFWKLQMHRAMPFIFAGLKIAVVSAVTGAVAAEFIGGGSGFGEQVRLAANRLDLARVFALIFYLSALGVALFALVSLAQRLFTPWDTTVGNPGHRRRARDRSAISTRSR